MGRPANAERLRYSNLQGVSNHRPGPPPTRTGYRMNPWFGPPYPHPASVRPDPLATPPFRAPGPPGALRPEPASGRRVVFALLVSGLVALASGVPATARAQDIPPRPPPIAAPCPDGRITDLFIDNHSIFDPVSIPADGRLRWAYRAANAVHVRTRDSFIASELLVGPGDCHDPVLLVESARSLRDFRFIAAADVFSVPQPDGSHHVVVETRDEWTTKLSIGVRLDEGLRFEGGSMVEENFLGRGATVGIFLRQELEQRALGGIVAVPGVGGSGLDVRLTGSRTRAGNSVGQLLEYPFPGEVGSHAFRFRHDRRRDLYNWVVPDHDSLSHLVLPVEEGGWEISAARRFGVPGHLLVLGGGLSKDWVRTDPVTNASGVVDRDFDAPVEVDPELSAPLAPQQADRTTTRINLIAGIRRVSFVQRRGLDVLRGLQDVPVGRELLLTAGRSLSDPEDFFSRVELFGGFAGRRSVGQLHATLEGRSVAGPEPSSRDLLAEIHAFLYRSFDGPLPQTLVLRGAVQAGWRIEGPFQLTLGGADAVRGLREDAFPGGRRVIVSLEDRVTLPGPFRDLVDLGLTFFGDLGRMYPGGVPLGTDSGWQGAIGTGLRVGFPAGSATVIRADLAFPLGTDVPTGPVLRIHAREWLGILGDFRSSELDRTRRTGINARFPGVARERRFR